jgi:hypothetical protein
MSVAKRRVRTMTKAEAAEKIVQECESHAGCCDCRFSTGWSCLINDVVWAHPVEWEDSNGKKCGNCAWLEKDDGFPYCLLMDLYTERDLDDEACEDFVEAQDDDNA